MSPKRQGSWPPSDELRERFGANLTRCHERSGLSREVLSFRSEVHVGSLSAMQRGLSIPRIDTFLRLTGALGVAPNDLVAGIVWMPPETTVTKGLFEAPPDPELAAEIAALRETGAIGAKRGGRR